jgi:hypothetical protein
VLCTFYQRVFQSPSFDGDASVPPHFRWSWNARFCYLVGPWWRSMEIETRATRVN